MTRVSKPYADWDQYAAIALGDRANYWQRDGGEWEIQQKPGGKFQLGRISGGRTRWVGVFDTLKEAMDHAG